MAPRLETWLTRATGVRVPFIQGGMMHLGNHQLVSAVCNAGALGFLTAFMFETPEKLREEIRKTKALVNGKNFGVNFTLLPSINPPDYAAYAEVAVDEGIFIFETAGNPKPITPILHRAPNYVHLHKVISIKHALKAQAAGASAISIDGFECAGHPGEDDIGSMVLMARAMQAVKIPVIASGGYADGRGCAAALAIGAQGVNMGTRWMCTKESTMHENIKKKITEVQETDTALLLKPLNNSVRCYHNKVAQAVLDEQAKPDFEFSKVAALMSGKRGAQVYVEGDPELGIWSLGQAAGLIYDVPTCEVLAKRLEKETIEALEGGYKLIKDSPAL